MKNLPTYLTSIFSLLAFLPFGLGATMSVADKPLVAASSNCRYLAYDACDFAPNQALHNSAGGSGWASNWQVQDNNTSLPGYQAMASSSSLTYADLQTIGNRIGGGINYLAAGRRLQTGIDGPFADYVTEQEDAIGAATNGQVLWASVLMNKTQDNDTDISAYFHSDNLGWCFNCTQNRIGMGYYGAESNVNGQRKWGLLLGNTVINTDVNVQLGQTALLVLKLSFQAGSTAIELFVNPNQIGGSAPASPSLAYNSPEPLLIRSFAYYGGSDPGNSQLDEIRLGTSYACVTPNANTVVLAPPVAAFTLLGASSGVAPFTVEVDASASYSPQGGALTYSWDFGDGGPLQSGIAASYTYPSGLGTRTITLTITDADNQQAASQQSIRLLDENGNFPCQVSVTSLAQADCSGQGGHIRINTEGQPTSFSLRNADNGLLDPSNFNQYTQLEAGAYTLSAEGQDGCLSEYPLHIRVDSSRCEGWQPSECAMQIGTNLTGMADWTSHRAFRNFLKNTRPEPIPYTDDCFCWSVGEGILDEVSFDANRYPTHLPQMTSEGMVRLRYFVSADGQNMRPNEDYVLLYEGVGEISLHGTISNEVSSPGRIQFTLGGDGTFWFQLLQSQQGKPVHNIRILRPEDEFADLESEPFYSVFLEKIAPFQHLRFMDWMHTNNNPVVHWEDRTPLGRYSYGNAEGVPYELIIQLANQLKKDIWICVPHAANDDYIAQMAALFKEQLDPELDIYLEYSNEVWNWIFDQAHYNNENRPTGLNYGRAYARKAKNVFDIWQEVYGEDQARLKRVIGIQAGFNYLNEQILAELDPSDWDYGSPTHYFGLDHEETGSPRLDLLGSNATVDDVMDNALHHFNDFKDLVKQDYRNIQVYGKKVITYEGGQHFVGNVFGIPYDYQESMWAAQNSDRMYELYSMVLDTIKGWGCRLATNYSLAAVQESIFGSWGVLDDIDVLPPYAVTAKKYQVHLDKLPPENCSEAPSSLQPMPPASPLLLFPNPVGEQPLQLAYEGPAEAIHVYNITGGWVKSGYGRSISLADLPAGIYLIRCGHRVGKALKMGGW